MALLGFTKIEQIHENLKALEVMRNWTQATEDRFSKILNNTPAQELDFPKAAWIEGRRQAALYLKK